jgi:hypothetical protein
MTKASTVPTLHHPVTTLPQELLSAVRAILGCRS